MFMNRIINTVFFWWAMSDGIFFLFAAPFGMLIHVISCISSTLHHYGELYSSIDPRNEPKQQKKKSENLNTNAFNVGILLSAHCIIIYIDWLNYINRCVCIMDSSIENSNLIVLFCPICVCMNMHEKIPETCVFESIACQPTE